MEENAPTLVALPTRTGHGRRYPAETVEMAYQLWAFKHGRNAQSVSDELSTEDNPLPVATVYRWAKEQRWAERADREIRELAPAIHAANVTSLIAGGPEAIQALREVTRGEGDPLTMGHRVKAAVAILDRTGYPTAVKVVPPGNEGAGDLPDYTALPMAELIERQRRILERKA